MLGAESLAYILAPVFECARNMLVAVYGLTSVLTAAFGHAGTYLWLYLGLLTC